MPRPPAAAALAALAALALARAASAALPSLPAVVLPTGDVVLGECVMLVVVCVCVLNAEDARRRSE